MKNVTLTADGSCIGNPGPGGWASILHFANREKVLSGSEEFTTNNRMELTAAIEGLRALKRPCAVTVRTDSEYVRRGITEYLPKWRKAGWCNSAGKPVANQDLWEELERLTQEHRVSWEYVRGHSGHPEQERCDALAHHAARQAPTNDSSRKDQYGT